MTSIQETNTQNNTKDKDFDAAADGLWANLKLFLKFQCRNFHPNSDPYSSTQTAPFAVVFRTKILV